MAKANTPLSGAWVAPFLTVIFPPENEEARYVRKDSLTPHSSMPSCSANVGAAAAAPAGAVLSAASAGRANAVAPRAAAVATAAARAMGRRGAAMVSGLLMK